MRIQSLPLLLTLLLLAPPLRAAFELVAEDPWQEAGAAAALWPSTPLVLVQNPACLGLMESAAIAGSAARPFGLRELDRAALGACLPMGFGTAGAVMAASGDRTYCELSFGGALAWRVRRGLVAGGSVCLRRLGISGYGTGLGCSADLGMVSRPVRGLYFGASLRGALRTDIGRSGDPCCPRSIEICAGACPAEGVEVSLGLHREEHLDPELSLLSAFTPDRRLTAGIGIRTGPLRFCAVLSVSIGPAGLCYACSQHSELPATHSVCGCWGSCRFRPEPIVWASEPDSPEASLPVDINTADARTLELVPGIGPARAAAIVSFRELHGPFETLEDLCLVPGIGPAMLEGMRAFITIGSCP
ncbi:helix-hairpin-helix domain-containing protein [Candidatus Fermentibacterales bacterium]|nr:helix-hairpin-helix domain-containing protein [Candidatus Fermentibacterales bacterium]